MIFSGTKKKPKIIILAAFLLAISFFSISFLYAPDIAEDKTRSALRALGLSTDFLPAPETTWAHVTYKDAPLDQEAISAAQTISAAYNPFSFFLSRDLAALSLDKLALFGEWAPKNPQSLSFSGWSGPQSIFGISKLPVKHLRLNDATLSVLTPDYGGLTVSFDFESALNNGKLEFQSHLKSAQKYISFTAGADGVIAENFADIDIEIDQGKFEVPEADIRATRMNGTVKMTQEKSGTPAITAEIRAGGLSLLSLPWQNASATYELKDGIAKIITEAKSTGVEDIELDLNIAKAPGTAAEITGSLVAEDGAALVEYLAQQSKVTLPKDDLAKIKKSKNVKIDFIYEAGGENKKIQYRFDNGNDAPYREIIVK